VALEKGAGSSPVGHPLTQVGTQRIITFCEDCEYASRHLGEQRTQAVGSAAIVSS
jgi:hypothetical protein